MNEKEVFMNYKRNNKWLGIIDYKSLIFLVIYSVVLWNILGIIPLSLEYIIYIFFLLFIPVLSLLCININNESAIDVVLIILKYGLKNKIYTDTKNLNVEDVYKKHKIFSKRDKKIKKDCNQVKLMI
jgi:hypothetical protein